MEAQQDPGDPKHPWIRAPTCAHTTYPLRHSNKKKIKTKNLEHMLSACVRENRLCLQTGEGEICDWVSGNKGNNANNEAVCIHALFVKCKCRCL